MLDAASLVQQAQNTVEMPSRSSARKWWIPVVQQRTDATQFRSCSSSSRSSTSLSWRRDKSQSREFRRRSRLHRFSSRQDGRCYCCACSQVYVMERTAEIPQLQPVQQNDEIPERQTLSPERPGEHTCPTVRFEEPVKLNRRSRRTHASKLTECRDDERDRVKTHIPEVCPGGVPTRTRQQQCVTQLEHGEHDDSQRSTSTSMLTNSSPTKSR